MLAYLWCLVFLSESYTGNSLKLIGDSPRLFKEKRTNIVFLLYPPPTKNTVGLFFFFRKNNRNGRRWIVGVLIILRNYYLHRQKKRGVNSDDDEWTGEKRTASSWLYLVNIFILYIYFLFFTCVTSLIPRDSCIGELNLFSCCLCS
jgi:hypothetical protein